jgi:hypothetical protein
MPGREHPSDEVGEFMLLIAMLLGQADVMNFASRAQA